MKQQITLSFKKELLLNIHNIKHLFKIALFDDKIEVNKDIETYYDLENEIDEGFGYKKGGKELSNLVLYSYKDYLILHFDNVIWEDATISAYGALVYNDSLINKNSVSIINFEEVYSSDAGDFILEFVNPESLEGAIKLL